MTENKPYYPILEAMISKYGFKKKDIADSIGISARAFSHKVTGKIDFWWHEIVIITSLFPNMTAEELFRHN